MNTTTDKPTILIVDDTPANLALLSNVLKPAYRTKVALDGEKALRIAISGAPLDLILLDVCMPRLGGPEAASILKRVLPKTRIILFTLFDDTIGKELAGAMGVDLVLSKTDGMAKLLHSIQTVIEPNAWQSVLSS